MKGVFEKKDRFNIAAMKTDCFKGYPPMFHPHCEIIYVINGEIDMVIDGIEHTLRSGEASVVFPYVTHCYQNAPCAEAIIILFDTDEAGELEKTLLTVKPVYPYTDKLSRIEPILIRLCELHRASDPIQTQAAHGYLMAIIGELLLAMPMCKHDIDAPDVSKKILSYCSEHFADEDISIGKISEALYISKSYVSKVFAHTLKYSFREYVNSLRVSHAKKLLSKKEIKMVAIMLECGFKNQSSFNRIFKDETGVTPREYRKQSRN